ncbi:MAG: hypothetical protein ABUK13_02745 [Gammaproteobacteria bacterium]
MVDTVRTIEDILLLLADNTSGDISPQDIRDAVVSLEALSPSVAVHSTVNSGAADDYYTNGFYDCPVTDSNLSDASPTQTHGTASTGAAAHAIVVASAVGTTDTGTLVLTVTGTSIDFDGVPTPGDTEIVVADCLSSATNQYYETVKSWLGQVTYTLSSSTGTTFAYSFNYGFAAYEDFGDSDFILDHFLFEWLGAATDAGFDIDFHHHKATGWTYHATAFSAGPAPIYKLSTDYLTDKSLISGEYGRWKRSGLSIPVDGSGSEGIVIHVTTTVNNSLRWCHCSANVKIQPTTA